MKGRLCVACGAQMAPGILPWHSRCAICGYEASDLPPAINEKASHEQVDEHQRKAGLEVVRIENFRTILSLLGEPSLSDDKSLLDVGAAHGWFLEQAAKRYRTLGIEPDEYVAKQTSKRGLSIRIGYFPSALREDEVFDVIIFNDVIEHIPDIASVLDACCKHLGANGALVLNLPNSNGLFYKIARFLTRFGWKGPFERLWQKGFPSPHVHYFNEDNLLKTVTKHGFVLLSRSELPSVRLSGLAERIRAGGSTGLRFLVEYVGTLLILPWTRLFVSDIMVSIFRKNAEVR